MRALASQWADGSLRVDRVEYTPFGTPSREDGLPSVITTYYAGREYDRDTGLYYNRARWYDPATGRWISEDPIGFAAGDANLYRYCGNSPDNATDPSGLQGDQEGWGWFLARASLEVQLFAQPLPVKAAVDGWRFAWTEFRRAAQVYRNCRADEVYGPGSGVLIATSVVGCDVTGLTDARYLLPWRDFHFDPVTGEELPWGERWLRGGVAVGTWGVMVYGGVRARMARARPVTATLVAEGGEVAGLNRAGIILKTPTEQAAGFRALNRASARQAAALKAPSTPAVVDGPVAYGTPYRQLSRRAYARLLEKVESRTITREQWQHLRWFERLTERRQAGIDEFWAMERQRLSQGLPGTRNWSPEQVDAILAGGQPKGIFTHHKYSVSQYPQLANDPMNIQPVTFFEHFFGWHGGSWFNATHGTPLRPELINTF